MSFLAFRRRDHADVHAAPPAVGTVGAAGFLVLLLYHLYTATPNTFSLMLALGAAAVTVELLYFERDVLEEEIETLEERALDTL